jgi:hypothetical protein
VTFAFPFRPLCGLGCRRRGSFALREPGRDAAIYYFGRGYTNGDAFVVFPALRVMHAGDMFARKPSSLTPYDHRVLRGVHIGLKPATLSPLSMPCARSFTCQAFNSDLDALLAKGVVSR